MFVHTDVYRRHGVFDLNFPITADFDWVVRVFQSNDLRSAYSGMVTVLMRTGGLSSRFRKKADANREMVESCKQHGIPTSSILIRMRYLSKLGQYTIFQYILARMRAYTRRVLPR